MDKRIYRLLVILSGIVGGLVLLPQQAEARFPDVGEVRILRDGITPMLADVIVVRFRSAHDDASVSAVIPNGYTIVGQYLDPQQTELYNPRFAKSTQVSSELTSAEDRLTRTYALRFTSPFHPLSAVAELQKLDEVEFAEPWYVAETQGNPNDPMWSQQAGLRTMQMPLAWDVTQGDANIRIAMSDNGVDQSHEDLTNSIWINSAEIPNNQLDDDGNGQIDDHRGVNFTYQTDGTTPGNTTNTGIDGHGTKTTGIGCATTNNAKGLAGVAHSSKMFPMKAAPAGTGSMVYGFQSLIYAANMGFEIVNCSWGLVKPYSPVDQSVIDYCLAKNVVVVASAGNHGNGSGGSGWYLLNYPSAYDGVLGVGECSPSDAMANTSGLGKNASVIAPSSGAFTTAAGGGYSSSNVNGTSFASPMASGVAALILSKYPQLKPREVAALMRRTTDDINDVNPDYVSMLCGRINAYKALTTDPTSIAALRIASVTRTFTNGVSAERFRENDTIDITYTVVNDLATVNEVMVDLELTNLGGWDVELITSQIPVGSFPSKENVTVGKFRILVKSIGSVPCTMGVLFTASGLADRAWDYLLPPAPMSVMQNQQLVYSIGDDGTFGYSSSLPTRQGIGFSWLKGYNLISPSGFIMSVGDSRALKGFDNVNNRSEFVAEKPFIEPQRNVGIMTDDGTSIDRKVGVRVEQKCTFPSANAQATVLSISVQNRTDADLNNVAAGYYFDWDIGYAGQNNTTKLAPEAIPPSFREWGEAQAFERSGTPVVVICAAVCHEVLFQSQAAGMMFDDLGGMSDEDVVRLLTSGVGIQTTKSGDACGLVGMRFPGALHSQEKRSFMIVIGVGSTYQEAADIVRQTIMEPNSVEHQDENNIAVYPSPVDEMLTVHQMQFATTVELVDVNGRVVHSASVNEQDVIHIDVRAFPSGMYVCRTVSPSGISTIPFAIVH